MLHRPWVMENRSGLLVDACLSEANGHAERVAVLHMIEPHADRPRSITLGGDKNFVVEVASATRIRTGETGSEAL